MTEHSKIPVPPSEPDEERPATLIERVVRNYDLVRLSPAPIPEDLVPPARAHRRYRRAEAEVVAEVATPVAETAAPEVVVGEDCHAHLRIPPMATIWLELA